MNNDNVTEFIEDMRLKTQQQNLLINQCQAAAITLQLQITDGLLENRPFVKLGVSESPLINRPDRTRLNRSTNTSSCCCSHYLKSNETSSACPRLLSNLK